MQAFKGLVTLITLLGVALNPIAIALIPCCCITQPVESEPHCCDLDANDSEPHECQAEHGSLPSQSAYERAACCCFKAWPPMSASRFGLDLRALQRASLDVPFWPALAAFDIQLHRREIERTFSPIVLRGPSLLALLGVWLK